MNLSSNDINSKLVFGNNPKRWFMIESVNGNLKIEYMPNQKIYVLSRTDTKPFDGTEDVGGEYYGAAIKPSTLEEILEYEVELLTGIQIEPESNMFQEFDWQFNEDKTKIYIYPVFIEERQNIEINIPDSLESAVSLFFGNRKKVRKRLK